MRDEDGNALFLIRMSGGPNSGETRVVPETKMPWPLPDRLEVPEELPGYYRKISESQLPAEVDDNDHVARGAEYEWVVNAGGGMLSVFAGGKPAPEAMRKVIEDGIRDGLVEVTEDGRYRLTQAGIDYVEGDILPRVGVTAEEAKAWVRERKLDA